MVPRVDKRFFHESMMCACGFEVRYTCFQRDRFPFLSGVHALHNHNRSRNESQKDASAQQEKRAFLLLLGNNNCCHAKPKTRGLFAFWKEEEEELKWGSDARDFFPFFFSAWFGAVFLVRICETKTVMGCSGEGK